ncbi:MAG TPA: hypothetical protein VJ814_10165 [Gaiellaceae bacterium]|nr:hypothetical protein [Gaiellaceae bacterium]
MIAYAPAAMGFLDRLRKKLAGPVHVQGGDPAGEVALQEEFGGSDSGAADLRRAEKLSGGAVMPGQATAEAAETAEANLQTEEAPQDPGPGPGEE